jgi:hypothetical protein
MTWDPPSNADLAADKPAKASHARRVRDLFASLAARETGSPWLNGRGAIRRAKHGPSGFVEASTGFAFHPGNNLIGTFTIPAGVTRIEVIVVGGAGCGGDGNNQGGTSLGGGGGGGSGAVHVKVIEVEPGEVFPVIIGAGGHPTLIDPSVDTTLDGFAIGDGARTTFGVWPRAAVAGGGKRGKDGNDANDGAGGAGGTTIDVVAGQPLIPSIAGATGYHALRVIPGGSGPARSGRGAPSIVGSGGASITSGSVGTDSPCAGAGGGGGYPPGSSGGNVGGKGGSGLVIVRF